MSAESPSPLDRLSANRLPRWMWIALGVLFLAAVGLAMALPSLQASIKRSAESEVHAVVASLQRFAKNQRKEFGRLPPTGESLRETLSLESASTRLLIAKDEVPEPFRENLFESWSPKFGPDAFQVLLLHTNRASGKTSLWLFKSDAAKPLKLLERPTDEIKF